MPGTTAPGYTCQPRFVVIPMPPSPTRRAIAALLATILIWGFSWIVMKQVLVYSGPIRFVALRYLLGAMVLFIALWMLRQPLKPPPLGATLLIGLCQTAAFQGLVQWALLEGGAGQVALLAYTMPFWAILLAWPWLKERPLPRHWVGLGLAALGLICILEPWHGMGTLLSTVLGIAGGAAWAAGVVLSKRLFQRQPCSALSLTAWQMLLGSLPLCALALIVPERSIDWTPVFIAGLAYSVLLASGLAWWLWSIVLKRVSTAVASLSSLGVPVVAVLLAWLLLNEQPSPAKWLGIALVLAGLCAVNGIGLRRRR